MSDNNFLALDTQTQENLKIWLEGPISDAEKEEIYTLLQKRPEEILNSFYKRLEFGTGGLRAVMGIGSNNLNRHTIAITTQGLANYLLKFPPKGKAPSVIIGFDCRHHSRFFAEVAAKVLAANQIQVQLFSELCPTPLVSFGCRKGKCSAAIMITASHNPPEYNGYKVYWSDGAQIVSPQDQGIIEEVNKICDLSKVKMIPDLCHPLIQEVGVEIDNAYLSAMEKRPFYREENKRNGALLKIAYSSLHGTGITILPKALYQWGFSSLFLVEEQCTPDGSFPSVKKPNPEEPAALELGIQTMKKCGADILIATDPDADRMGLVVLHENEAVLLTGNQIACLLAEHICNALKKKGELSAKTAFIKTIATTDLFKEIVASYGARSFDVLTGFKYIAEKIHKWKLEKSDFQFIFGAEESYGYLLGTDVRDKDAIISSLLISEAALQAKLRGKTLVDFLYDLYKKHGVFYEELFSLQFEESKIGRDQISKGIDKLKQKAPAFIAGVAVTSLEDYDRSLKTFFKTSQTHSLDLPKYPAYLFQLEDGSKILIRPSGTEPKIKIYCGVLEKSPQNIPLSIAACKSKARAYLKEIAAFLKPAPL